MPAPIDPQRRTAILTDITTGKLSRNAIATKHGVSPATVGNIAKAQGLTDPFDRTATKNATEALRADNKAKRLELQALFLQRSREALLAMDQQFVVFKIGGKDNVYTEHEVPIPPTGDQRNLMIIAATGLDKALVIERHDTDDRQLSAVDTWLAAMMGDDDAGDSEATP